MKLKLIFAWYDIWIGFFWDSSKCKLYFFPIPMVGVVIHFYDYAISRDLRQLRKGNEERRKEAREMQRIRDDIAENPEDYM